MAQRVGPVSWVQTDRFQRSLRAMNAGKYNVMFVRVNAIALGRRARTRDAIGAVRHVFLDADHDGLALLSRVEARRDLPIPSYVNLGESDRGRVLRALEAHERPLPRVTITQGLREPGGGGPANLLPLGSRVWPLLTSQRLAVPANDLTIAIRERLRAHGCATQEQAMLFS